MTCGDGKTIRLYWIARVIENIWPRPVWQLLPRLERNAITYRAAKFSVVEVQHFVHVCDILVECRQRQCQLHHAVLTREELLRRAPLVVVGNNIEAAVKVTIISQSKIEASRGSEHYTKRKKKPIQEAIQLVSVVHHRKQSGAQRL